MSMVGGLRHRSNHPTSPVSRPVGRPCLASGGSHRSAAITVPGFREMAGRGDRLARLPLLIAVPTVLLGILGSVSLVVERGYGFYLAMPCLLISLGVTLALAWDVLQQASTEGMNDL